MASVGCRAAPRAACPSPPDSDSEGSESSERSERSERSESSERSGSPATSTATPDNPLAEAACAMALPAPVQYAAERSQDTRQSSDVRSLPTRSLCFLLQCVLAIVCCLLRRWAPNDPGGLYWALRARMDKEFAADRTGLDSEAPVFQAAAAVLRALPPRSQESQAIRAVFGAAGYKALQWVTPAARAEGGGSEDSASGTDHSSRDSGAEVTLVTQWAYRRARRHFRAMTCGSTLQRLPAARRSRSDAAVQSVVDFMYRNDNTTTLSWGRK